MNGARRPLYKTRMTEERKRRLDSMGFMWSKTKCEESSGNNEKGGALGTPEG